MSVARTLILSLLCLNMALPVAAASTPAMGPSTDIHLFTAYPERTVQPGTSTHIDVTLFQSGAIPSVVKLELDGIPSEWNAQLLGAGQPISSAMAYPDKGTPLQIRLDIPADVPLSTRHFALHADTGAARRSLPLALSFSQHLPSRLRIESSLPALRGSQLAVFDFPLTLSNDGGSDTIVTLSTDGHPTFEYAFTEAQGTQQLTSLPLKAGESKQVKLSVRVPPAIEPARYPLKVSAVAQDASAFTTLSLELIGQPRLRLSGRDGLLSFQAIAGETQTIPMVLTNEGAAPAGEVQLSGSGPIGWQIAFEPHTITRLNAGEHAEIQLRVIPSTTSLVGDYMITARAATQGEIAGSELRVTVNTSGLWGITGMAVIAIALIILAGAIAKYGRR